MYYRVVVVSQFHRVETPEVDVFYCKTEQSLQDFVRELVVDLNFDVNKWFNHHFCKIVIPRNEELTILPDSNVSENHIRESGLHLHDHSEGLNPQAEFDKQIAAVQLDKTTIDFEGHCCEDCHDWLYISEYKQERVYKI